MHRLTMPSPALVISVVALFVSLGGVSYGVATGSIDGREIKNNTVRSGDIKNNSILSRDLRNNAVLSRDLRNNEVRGRDIRNSTIQGRDVGANQIRGADVLESSLGLVPKANLANSATTAGSAGVAGSLSSQKKISYQAGVVTPAQEIYNSGKLKLTATCGAAAITVAATTNVSNATLSSDGRVTANTDDPDFDTGDTPTLTADTEERTVVYSEPGGQVVVVQYGAFESASGCIVKGVAQAL